MYKTSGTVTLKTLCSVQAFRSRKRQLLIRIIEVVLALFGLFLQMIFVFPKQLTKGEADDLPAMLSGHGIKVKKCSKSVL